MASRHQRRKRAQAKREAISRDRLEAFLANERAKQVKVNLARDNREFFTLRDHLQRPVLRHSKAYSGITNSYVRVLQEGGLRECLNLDRPIGDTDRQHQALKARLSKK